MSDPSRTWKLTHLHIRRLSKKRGQSETDTVIKIYKDSHISNRIYFGRETPNWATTIDVRQRQGKSSIIPRVEVETSRGAPGSLRQVLLCKTKKQHYKYKISAEPPLHGVVSKTCKKDVGSMTDNTYKAQRPRIHNSGTKATHPQFRHEGHASTIPA
jgi:hypothetical protein